MKSRCSINDDVARTITASVHQALSGSAYRRSLAPHYSTPPVPPPPPFSLHHHHRDNFKPILHGRLLFAGAQLILRILPPGALCFYSCFTS